MNKFADQARLAAEEMNIHAAQAVLRKTMRALDEHEEQIMEARKEEEKNNTAKVVIGILGAVLTAAVTVMAAVELFKDVKEMAEEEKAELHRLEMEKNKKLYRQLSVTKGRH